MAGVWLQFHMKVGPSLRIIFPRMRVTIVRPNRVDYPNLLRHSHPPSHRAKEGAAGARQAELSSARAMASDTEGSGRRRWVTQGPPRCGAKHGQATGRRNERRSGEDGERRAYGDEGHRVERRASSSTMRDWEKKVRRLTHGSHDKTT